MNAREFLGLPPEEVDTTESITSALKQIESGGNYGAINPETGASGAYQFMPDTWASASRAYTQDVYGKPVVLPMTDKTQDDVAKHYIKKLKDQGYSKDEIASIHYTGRPDRQNIVGTNPKYGNKYDAPSYMRKFREALGNVAEVSEAQASPPKQIDTSDHSKARAFLLGESPGIGGWTQEPNHKPSDVSTSKARSFLYQEEPGLIKRAWEGVKEAISNAPDFVPEYAPDPYQDLVAGIPEGPSEGVLNRMDQRPLSGIPGPRISNLPENPSKGAPYLIMKSSPNARNVPAPENYQDIGAKYNEIAPPGYNEKYAPYERGGVNPRLAQQEEIQNPLIDPIDVAMFGAMGTASAVGQGASAIARGITGGLVGYGYLPASKYAVQESLGKWTDNPWILGIAEGLLAAGIPAGLGLFGALKLAKNDPRRMDADTARKSYNAFQDEEPWPFGPEPPPKPGEAGPGPGARAWEQKWPGWTEEAEQFSQQFNSGRLGSMNEFIKRNSTSDGERDAAFAAWERVTGKRHPADNRPIGQAEPEFTAEEARTEWKEKTKAYEEWVTGEGETPKTETRQAGGLPPPSEQPQPEQPEPTGLQPVSQPEPVPIEPARGLPVPTREGVMRGTTEVQDARPIRMGQAEKPFHPPSVPWNMAFQRIEEEGIPLSSVDKPQGLYVSPAGIESPHADLGGTPSTLQANPKANVLNLGQSGFFDTNRGYVGESAGVSAARRFFGDKEVSRMMQARPGQLTGELKEKYPDVDWSRYYDQQEMVEGLAGLEARKRGYDALWSTSTDPSFNEFVALTDKAFLDNPSPEAIKIPEEGRPEITVTPPSDSEFVQSVDSAFNRRARENLLVEEGVRRVPGIRLQEAEEAGRWSYLLDKGEVTEAQFNDWVSQMEREGRRNKPEGLGVTLGKQEILTNSEPSAIIEPQGEQDAPLTENQWSPGIFGATPDEIRSAEKSIAETFGRTGESGNLYRPTGKPSASHIKAEEFARTHGIKPVFYDSDDPTYAFVLGWNEPGTDQIFLNAGPHVPHGPVAAHESTHKLASRDKPAYRIFASELMPTLKGFDDFSRNLNSARKQTGLKPLSKSLLQEEFVATVVGDIQFPGGIYPTEDYHPSDFIADRAKAKEIVDKFFAKGYAKPVKIKSAPAPKTAPKPNYALSEDDLFIAGDALTDLTTENEAQKIFNEVKRTGINPSSLARDYGKDAVRLLNSKLFGVVKKNGIDLDVVASDHGFKSGDDLYQQLSSLKPFGPKEKQAIAALDRATKGEPLTPKQFELVKEKIEAKKQQYDQQFGDEWRTQEEEQDQSIKVPFSLFSKKGGPPSPYKNPMEVPQSEWGTEKDPWAGSRGYINIGFLAPGIDAIKGTKEGIQSLLIPGSVSKEHLRAAEVGASKLGTMHRSQEIENKRLAPENRTFTRMGVHNPRTPLSQNPGIIFMSEASSGRQMSPVSTPKMSTNSAEMQRIVDKFNQGFQKRITELARAGEPLQSIRNNYFPGMWTNESHRAFNQAIGEAFQRGLGTGAVDLNAWSAADKLWVHDRVKELMKSGQGSEKSALAYMAKRPLSGKESFRKEKVFDDIMTGVEFGLEPISPNPVDLVKLKYAEMDRSIMANQWFREEEANGNIINVDNSGRPMKRALRPRFDPSHWTKIDDKYGTIWMKDPKTNLPVKVGYRMATKPVADIMNNYLSSSLYNNRYFGIPFKGWMSVANLLNQTQLGMFSGFHAGFTTLEAQISANAEVVRDIYGVARGNRSPSDLVKTTGKAIVAMGRTGYTGSKYLQEWYNPTMDIPLDVPVGQLPSTPQHRVAMVAKAAELAGGGLSMERGMQTGQIEPMIRNWYGGEKVKAALRSPIALVELGAKPILQWLVPRQKMGVFGEMAGRIIEQNSTKTMSELRPELRQVWNRIDARLGQVRYDRLFMNNVAKNVVQGSIRAPGWTGGTIAEVGGSVKDAGTFFYDWIKSGKPPENIPDRVAYTAALVASGMIGAGLMTYLFTGEKPKGMDYWAFRDGTKDEYGRDQRWVFPTYNKDLFAYWENPAHVLLAKTHPFISLLSEQIQGKDYYNVEMKGLSGHALAAAKQFIPFWIRGTLKASETSGGLVETLKTSPQKIIAPEFGIMPATSAYTLSPAEKMANEIIGKRASKAPITQEQKDKQDAKREIVKSIRTGQELPEDSKSLLSKREIDSAKKKGHKTYLQGQVSSSYIYPEESFQIYGESSDEEKPTIKKIVLKKIVEKIKRTKGDERNRLKDMQLQIKNDPF